MKQYLALYLILAVFCYFNGIPVNRQTVAADNPSYSSGKILVQYKGSDNPSTLSYRDQFFEDFTLVLEKADRTIELETEGFLILKDINHKSSASYILLPGDTLTYVKAAGEGAGYFEARDSIRNNELAVFPEMVKALGRIGTAFGELDVLNKYGEQPAKLDSIIERRHSDRQEFLQRYTKGHVLRPEILLMAENVLQYSYYKDKLIHAYFWGNKGNNEPLLEEIKSLVGNADAVHLAYPDFLSICQLTASVLARGEKDKGENLKMRYNLYDELLEPELTELMQFDVLNNSVSQKQSSYLELVAGFMASSANQKLKDYLQEQQKLAALRRTIDYEVALLNKAEEVSDMQALLQQYKGHVVYIDLWASWCRPCLAEMPASKALQQEYEGKKVAFLYLSLDEKKSSWVKALVNQKDVMSEQNSYLLLDNYNSAFATRYNVKTIPRYLLLDKTGTVVDANAPRPGEAETRTLIDSYLMMK